MLGAGDDQIDYLTAPGLGGVEDIHNRDGTLPGRGMRTSKTLYKNRFDPMVPLA